MIGEGEYNLNALKEIQATNSYFVLEEKVRKCQNRYPVHNCTADLYIDTILTQCGCVPLKMGLLIKVPIKINSDCG